MSDEERIWDAGRVRDVMRDFRLPHVLVVLVRTGVLDVLARGPATVEGIAAETGVDGAALARLLGVLVSVGILEKRGESFAPNQHLARDLAETRLGSPLDAMRHVADGADKWWALEETLRRGHAEYGDRQDVTADAARNEAFIRAMHAYAGPMARRFAEIVPREGAASFLDLGGGPGTFAMALLDAWPDARVAIADLPLTLRTTRRVLADAGLADRIETIEADFYHDPECDLGGPWDLVLVSSVIHSEGEAENRALFSRVRRIVSPGGRIVVREIILEEDRTGPPRAAMFDAHMLVSTRRGRCYSLPEIASMLRDAGFRDPRLLSDLEEGFVVATAG